jgi:hypothetical protein
MFQLKISRIPPMMSSISICFDSSSVWATRTCVQAIDRVAEIWIVEIVIFFVEVIRIEIVFVEIAIVVCIRFHHRHLRFVDCTDSSVDRTWRERLEFPDRR